MVYNVVVNISTRYMMKKFLLILLTIAMAITLVGCNQQVPTYNAKFWMSYKVNYQDREYDVPYKSETLTYDVKIGEQLTPGVLTLTFKSYMLGAEEVLSKTFNPGEATSVTSDVIGTQHTYTVNTGDYTLEATLTFESGDMVGDKLYYFCHMDSAMNPIASYRELILDYEKTATTSRYGADKKPLSQVYYTTYNQKATQSTSVYAVRSAFGSDTYTVGRYEGVYTSQTVDTMQLLYSARSISTLANGGNVSAYISIPSPIENTTKQMSMTTYSQDVAVDKGTYIETSGILGDSTSINCTAISIMLYNETVSGQRLTYYYSNNPLKVSAEENAPSVGLVPVMMVEDNIVYTLRSISVVK